MMSKGIIFFVSAVMMLAAVYIVMQMTVPVRLSEPVEIRIEKGMTFREASSLLMGHGVTRDVNLLVALARISGHDRTLKPGYYSFRGNITMWDVFRALRDGFIIQNAVTIVEGDSLVEIKKKLISSSIMAEAEFDSLASDGEFLLSLEIDAPTIEGYLYPDTYLVPKGFEPEETLRIMVARLREEYNDEMGKRAAGMGMNERQVLTLASIIEKEAVMNEEREIISAVYHNRLKKRMPLQADPTAVYGIKPQSEGITRSDLRRRTPYNTYIIRGLPPGPIASAGIKSIKASLYPADVPYLYFVSNGDGTHTFSATLSDHLRAVEGFRTRTANAPAVKNTLNGN